MNKNLETLQEEVSTILTERGYEVKAEVVPKQNVVLHGIIFINNPNRDYTSILKPTFYIEGTKNFTSKTIDLDLPWKIADELEILYTLHKDDFENKEILEDEISDKIKDKDYVLSSVFPCLINAQKSEELLEKVPFIRFEDLALIFKIKLSDIDCCSIITNEYLKYLDVTVEEIKDIAFNNKIFGSGVIIPMKNMLKEIVLKESREDNIEELLHSVDILANEDMFVLTNGHRIYGASTLFTDKDILKMFSEKISDDIIILPSSIHEVILMKKSFVCENSSYNNLKAMVEEVNRNEVSTDEYLSDNIYIYEREKDTIKIVNSL